MNVIHTIYKGRGSYRVFNNTLKVTALTSSSQDLNPGGRVYAFIHSAYYWVASKVHLFFSVLQF